MAYLVRSVVLTGYSEVARSLGLDPYRMLETIGLPASCLTEPESRISTDAVGRLLEVSAAAAGVDDFALRLVATRQLSLLGPVGLVARDQPTVAKALEAVARYISVHNEAVTLALEPAKDMVILKLDFALDRPGRARQAVELLVGAAVRIVRALLGREWRPLAVCFLHSPPSGPTLHREVLGPVVEFDHEFNGLLLTQADLDKPIPNADPEMAVHLIRYLDQLAQGTRTSTADVVRRLIVDLLPTGQCTADKVAKRLGVDRRTVHGRLAREGLSFSDLLNDVRRHAAVSHLETSDRSVAAISEVLGFSATSAFTRWFQAQFGSSPTAWRRAKLKATTP